MNGIPLTESSNSIVVDVDTNEHVHVARPDRHKSMPHTVALLQYWVSIHDLASDEGLARPHLERAIGVICRPETELQDHYFEADLVRQFDVAIHVDHTRTREPLGKTPLWDLGESPPETFPTGL